MCHPLPLTGVDMELRPNEEESTVEISATVRLAGRTGVEMEALAAVSVAALTVLRYVQGRGPGYGDRQDKAGQEVRRQEW